MQKSKVNETINELIHQQNAVLFSMEEQKANNQNANVLNENNSKMWSSLSKEQKALVGRVYVYGNSADFKNENQLRETMHTPSFLIKKNKYYIEESTKDCVNRIVIQPSPFVQENGRVLENLMQATVVSPCFLSYQDETRPGGEYFLRSMCRKSSSINGKYDLTDKGQDLLRQQILKSAKLFFYALDENECEICTIPDVGCGAYLNGLTEESKRWAQDIIRNAWRDVAETENFRHLQHIIFTGPRVMSWPENKSNSVWIYNANGKDNLKFAMELALRYPDKKIAATIAGAVQGMGGDFKVANRGSQEEAAYRMQGNMSGPILENASCNIKFHFYPKVQTLGLLTKTTPQSQLQDLQKKSVTNAVESRDGKINFKVAFENDKDADAFAKLLFEEFNFISSTAFYKSGVRKPKNVQPIEGKFCVFISYIEKEELENRQGMDFSNKSTSPVLNRDFSHQEQIKLAVQTTNNTNSQNISSNNGMTKPDQFSVLSNFNQGATAQGQFQLQNLFNRSVTEELKATDGKTNLRVAFENENDANEFADVLWQEYNFGSATARRHNGQQEKKQVQKTEGKFCVFLGNYQRETLKAEGFNFSNKPKLAVSNRDFLQRQRQADSQTMNKPETLTIKLLPGCTANLDNNLDISDSKYPSIKTKFKKPQVEIKSMNTPMIPSNNGMNKLDKFSVERNFSQGAAASLSEQKIKPLLIVFANNLHSGGFGESQAHAQEENVLKDSNASYAIPQNYERGLIMTYDGLYVIADALIRYENRDFPVDLAFVPMLDLNRNGKSPENRYGFPENRAAYLRHTISMIMLQLHAAKLNGNVIVTGRQGCGIFQNQDADIAAIIYAVANLVQFQDVKVVYALGKDCRYDQTYLHPEDIKLKEVNYYIGHIQKDIGNDLNIYLLSNDLRERYCKNIAPQLMNTRIESGFVLDKLKEKLNERYSDFQIQTAFSFIHTEDNLSRCVLTFENKVAAEKFSEEIFHLGIGQIDIRANKKRCFTQNDGTSKIFFSKAQFELLKWNVFSNSEIGAFSAIEIEKINDHIQKLQTLQTLQTQKSGIGVLTNPKEQINIINAFSALCSLHGGGFPRYLILAYIEVEYPDICKAFPKSETGKLFNELRSATNPSWLSPIVDAIIKFCNKPGNENVVGLIKIKAINENRNLTNFERINLSKVEAGERKSGGEKGTLYYEWTSFYNQTIRSRTPDNEDFYEKLAALNVNDYVATADFVHWATAHEIDESVSEVMSSKK